MLIPDLSLERLVGSMVIIQGERPLSLSMNILSYMKLSGCPVGLLINFNVPVLTQGIKRFRL